MLLDRIAAAGGFLGFADYMAAALYTPGLGYYSAGARKFGGDGDFVTAPELGAVFARCLARVAGHVLDELGGGVILEIGGGSGVLAADMLAHLRQAPPDRYLILEVSADLRARQRETIAAHVPDLLSRVEWLDALPAEPLPGLILANEVLDALPVERFRIRAGSVLQLGVTTPPDGTAGFAWAERPAPPALATAVRDLENRLGVPLPEGYTSEISLRQADVLGGWLAALHRGLALFVDYGGSRREVYHPDRRDGTLACHYRHHRHDDPFLLPGLQDITAWVDFSAAAAAGVAAGCVVAAYATQAHALLASGVLTDLAAAGTPTAQDRLREVQQVKHLLLPGEMGERFKVLALARDFAPGISLTVRDLRDRL
jgi:SAM-dependent MidA family methyltransferase